jgi:hypothetical protein
LLLVDFISKSSKSDKLPGDFFLAWTVVGVTGLESTAIAYFAGF